MSRFSSFSPKQRMALGWWCPPSPHYTRDGIICDGAVRSGKTLCLSLSFVLWASASFQGRAFGLCGRTISSLRRNLVTGLLELLDELGMAYDYKLSKNYLDISWHSRCNRFYLFGGKDEASAALIQGVTLAGVLFDEVALMPRSFVEQALARCSVEGSRFWFNCNPEHPHHWFYREWIQKASQKNMLYLHFRMEDNPSLSPAMLRRYQSLYSGSFYERFVLGRWVAPAGLVYPGFSAERHICSPPPECNRFYISCDYGTVNPTSMGLWGCAQGVWYRLAEYYHCARTTGLQKTDEEHYAALEQLAQGYPITAVVVDPSAASFIETIRRHGQFRVLPAQNQVLPGINAVAEALRRGQIAFSPTCRDTLREFALYRWDERARGDTPLKQNDHAMDDIRYFVATVLAPCGEAPGFFASHVCRGLPETTLERRF